eukprot:4577433-Karenia_brevis.AAC.1
MLRAVASQAVWSKERLRQHGYLTDGLCSCGHIASLEHDVWHCDRSHAVRESWGLEDHIFELRRAHPEWALWHTCILPDPTRSFPKPTIEIDIRWAQVGPAGPVFDAPGYGDGSGKHANISTALRRCGWAVVSAYLGQDG